MVSAKIFIQSLWLIKCGWDDPLPQGYVERWEEWLGKLPSINEIEIPRFLNYVPVNSYIEIHGLADASQRACSAVVYLRILSENSSSCSLLVAKTKVAPQKTLSVPRLELVGASILAKLAYHYASLLPIEISSVHLWSDSKDVLFCSGSILRVGRRLLLTDVLQFRHCFLTLIGTMSSPLITLRTWPLVG